MSLVKSSILKRKAGLPWQSIEGQALILDSEKSEAHELCEVSSFVWSEFNGEKDLADIINSLASEYEVNIDDLAADVLSLANDFIKMELVQCL